MARIKQGFLGNASGKLGNIVFARWRNIETARQYQPDVQDAKSPEQIKQRSRMVALLNFLKPINTSFIRFFNAPFAKQSTPWAVAIKSNMKGVSPEGIFELKDLKLGKPKYPPLKLYEIIYNPFIDQIQLRYNAPRNYTPQDPYPNVGCSALGKYPSVNSLHNFDIRHQLCFFPLGHFFTLINKDLSDETFFNFWQNGMMWFIYFDRNTSSPYNNVSLNLGKPTHFVPKSMISAFNTNVKENPVPDEAISWNYVFEENKWHVVFNMDFNKTSLREPERHKLVMWGVGFVDGQVYHTEPYEWSLSSDRTQFEINEEGFSGSGIMLYAVYDDKCAQVSRFNRIYVDRGTDFIYHPYFLQLFKSNYTFPSSFVLSDNNCGFCGIIEELLSDFINLYEKGALKYEFEPVIGPKCSLLILPSENGSVNVSNYFCSDGNTYNFLKDKKAVLTTRPDPNFVFSHWEGPDAMFIQYISLNRYEILMDKDRELIPIFIPIHE